VYGVWYLTADYRLRCDGEDYAFYSTVAALGILVYPIGTPLLYFTLLYRNRHKLHATGPAVTSAACRKRFGFIYGRYEPEYYWWELVEMTRKLLLTGGILFLAPGSVAQLACALVIAAYFMAAHIKCQPYADDDDDNLQVPLYALISMISSSLLSTPSDDDNLQSCSLISTVLVLVLGIMIKSVSMQDADKKASANDKCNNPRPPAMMMTLPCLGPLDRLTVWPFQV
jgi:hypothetical protein